MNSRPVLNKPHPPSLIMTFPLVKPAKTKRLLARALDVDDSYWMHLRRTAAVTHSWLAGKPVGAV